MSKNWSDIQEYEDLSHNKKLFADWLAIPKKLRKENEFFQSIDTQNRLAEKLNVTPRTLSRWKKKSVFQKIVEERQREIVGLDGLGKVINALIVRAEETDDPDKVKQANKAAEILFNWLYNRDFSKGSNVNQFQGQAQGQSSSGILQELHEHAQEHDPDDKN